MDPHEEMAHMIAEKLEDLLHPDCMSTIVTPRAKWSVIDLFDINEEPTFTITVAETD